MVNNGSRQTILVVDDDTDLTTLIAKSLTREGFSVVKSARGKEALSSIDADLPDLMLMDLKLPDMSGEEIIKSLTEKGISVPFIVITGFGDERVAVDLMKMGARDYMVKDAGFLPLLPTVVNQVLSQLESERKLRKFEKALRDSEERYRTLALVSPVSIFRTNQEGFIIYANKQWCEISGIGLSNARRTHWTGVIEPADRQLVLSLWEKTIRCSLPFKSEFRLQQSDGAVIWVIGQVAAETGPEGQTTGYVGTLTDISSLKRAEEALQQRTIELERSNKALDQFASITSHDLQEPLRMVSSYVQLLEKNYRDRLDPSANQFIQFAVDGAARMHGLIQDLLVFSRLGTQAIEFNPVDCEQILEETLQNLEVSIRENDAVITHDPLPVVQADKSQLRQLFQNLLTNAIKFRGEAPPVIHVTANPSDEEWIFSFKDNGIGIEPEFFERIFEIFQRLHPKDEYPGTGIGLAICQKIVERHSGRTWLESEPGKGSSFYFSLPLH